MPTTSSAIVVKQKKKMSKTSVADYMATERIAYHNHLGINLLLFDFYRKCLRIQAISPSNKVFVLLRWVM